MSTRVEKLLPWLLGIPLGLAIFYFYRMWMAPIPLEVFERHAEPLRVTAGSEVTVTWKETRSAVCYSMIYRALIGADGRIVVFEPIESPARDIGPASGSFTFVVPPMQTPGPLLYRVKTEFFCNWVQELLGGPWLPLPDIRLEYQSPKGN